MQNEREETGIPSAITKLLVTMLSVAAISSVGALISTWNNSNLTEQRIDNIDSKYELKSGRIEFNQIEMRNAFAKHLTDDGAHQLMIQRQHLEFKGFMEMLDDAHEDIEGNKHQIELMLQGCCKQNGYSQWNSMK